MKSKVLFLALIGIMVACTVGQELPPNPPPPGAPTPRIGVGAAIPPSYADPTGKFSVTPSELELAPKETRKLQAKVGNQDYVYRYGYILKNREWERFEFTGESVPNSNWLRNSAETSQDISLENFQKGNNWILAYGCKTQTSGWYCNDNKWMVQTYSIKQKELLPPEPIAPLTETETKPTGACTDSDGANYQIKGQVTISGQTFEDACVLADGAVIGMNEYLCMNNRVDNQIVLCKCDAGRCN